MSEPQMPAARTWSDWSMPLSGRTIVLDAGHGGPDGGAVSKSGLVEKDLNLAIVLQLRDYLQQSGALVYVTREGDTDLASPDTKAYRKRKSEDLAKRAKFVQEHQADLMISIHMNSIPSPKWSGAQTFYYPNHEGNAALAKLACDIAKRGEWVRIAHRLRIAARGQMHAHVTCAPHADHGIGHLKHQACAVLE